MPQKSADLLLMATNVVWVSEGGLIITTNEEGYSLEDPLHEPIQWCDSLHELKRIIEDIELNPFNVGDKVRVKRCLHDGTYKKGAFDEVYHVGNNGAMSLMFYEESGISSCVYTWQDLQAYNA
jgi:hypothetical protein